MKRLPYIAILLIPLFILGACSNESFFDKGNSTKLDPRDNNSQLRNAITAVFSNNLITSRIDSQCVLSDGDEWISISDIITLIGANVNTSYITNAGIDGFYLPFTDLNLTSRSDINIINLDNQIDSLHIYDLNGSVNNKSDIEQNFTIMFKTQVHPFDSQAPSGTPGGWRPWRRCYCKTIPHIEGGTSSQSKCTEIDINKADAGRCGRTGFFKQECSGDPCGI